MPILEISGLRKSFGSLPIIRDVSISVEGGGIYGFLGPNGAGKTTSIRLITGILKPTAGKILIDGIDINEDPIRAKQKIGYIPDTPYLYPKLTGEEYLNLIADLYSATNYASRKNELLERFEIYDRKDDFIESYSHGMKQKISIVAACLPMPSLIVVDEPLIGLDPPAARNVKDLFLEETARGAAIFMSTHLLEIAEALCDDITVLDRGEVIAAGPMKEILHSHNARLEEVFMRLLAERYDEGSVERSRWEKLAEAAGRAR